MWMRIVFMGTPALAVPALRALVRSGHDVCLVVTQPPHPSGRGRREQQPPVAIEAASFGLALLQPERVRRPEAQEAIRAAAPDVIVVAAYGQILPPSLLEIPRSGCVNVHPSLLPRHRGAAPISAAILAGDAETGVSIMLMDAGMDTGPVVAQTVTPIDDADDQVTLTARLAELGAELLISTLAPWVAGELLPMPQDEARVTVTRPVGRADGALAWHEPAVALWRRIRAYAEWPQGYTHWENKLLRIRMAYVDESASAEPGLVVAWGSSSRAPKGAAVGTGRGLLVLDTIGLEGRQLLAIDAFLRGQPRFVGTRLTS